MAGTLKVKLVRSGYGHPKKLRDCLRGLGLTRTGRERELQDTPEVRGMIARVSHLVEVTAPSGTE